MTVLPHALAYNRDVAGEAMGKIATALGGNDTAGAAFDLAQKLGAPRSLKELCIPEEGIERVAIRELLQIAYAGRCPR